MPDFQYRKSSYSNPERECVEVATNTPATVAIRDSKRPTGPSLHVTPTAWAAFQRTVREGLTCDQPVGLGSLNDQRRRPAHSLRGSTEPQDD